MTKRASFAKEDVMQDYLDGLLKEPEDPADVTARTARLLEQAALDIATEEAGAPGPDVVTPAPVTPLPVIAPSLPEQTQFEQINQALQAVEAPPVIPARAHLKDQLEERFQALFFEVAGLTLAVPLITLGGIHKLDKISPLFGKPDWFKGVMLHREQKLNVVDTAIWVMPEKYDQNLAEKLNYQYLIMLSDSLWGLASDKLVNTVTLSKQEVKWREVTGKRPWLAGMVKDKMCALLDVSQLITMLNSGLGSQD
nr:chemotaxis protein CheW [Salinimonas lutimaris]